MHQLMSCVSHGAHSDVHPLLLAPKQWIEAIDERHRYGGLLKHYWQAWAASHTTQGFFHWLDGGEGKTLDLAEAPREELERSSIQYCTHLERQRFEVAQRDGLLTYAQSGQVVTHTNEERHMFVIGIDETLYIGVKVPGRFHHSSFLAGGACLGAGYVVVEAGRLRRISPHSGHYRPTQEDFARILHYFRSVLGNALEEVVIDPIEKPVKLKQAA